MADLTLKLIWYKLGEASGNMADSAGRFQEWYENFSWVNVDVLDMIFLGWIFLAFVVVGVVSVLVRFFGRGHRFLESGKTGGVHAVAGGVASATGTGVTGAPGDAGPSYPGESCAWLNSAISWFYLHYNSKPEFVETWIAALNEYSKNNVNDALVRFDQVRPGSLPPTVSSVQSTVAPHDHLTINAHILWKDVTFGVTVTEQGHSGVTDCDVSVTQLQGELKVHTRKTREDVQVSAAFASRPTVTLTVTPRSSQNLPDTKKIENAVVSAITGAVTVVMVRPNHPYQFSNSVPITAKSIQPVSAQLSASHTRTPSSISQQDKRLLVKIIKANGLGDREYGSTDAYTHISMDVPSQKHTTSVVKNTVNPFWDEHFLFDLTEESRQLKLNVYDREKPSGEDHIGYATVEIVELKRNPSSRQIIPLQNPANRMAAGTMTVEFLFMEPAEAQMMQLDGRVDLTSPRRRIETNRTVTPGGTLVTTTTTTTEKPKDARVDSFTESPNKVHKTESMNTYTGSVGNDSVSAGDGGSDYSPYSSQRSYPGTTDSSLTASQAEPSQRHVGSPKLTVTGAEREKSATHPMTESTPTDESARDGMSMTSEQSRQIPEIKKSKSFASTLKKRFSRSKKPRSHSADRALTRDPNLLTPPDQKGHHTTDDLDHLEIPESGLRKSRSSSLSSSLRRLFKKKKRGDGFASRDSSVSRSSTRERGRSRESSFAQHEQQSPQMSYTGSSSGTATPELYHASRSLPPGMRLEDSNPPTYRN